MEISIIKTPVDFGSSANVTQTTASSQTAVSVPTANTSVVVEKLVTDPTDDSVIKKSANPKDVKKMTEAMNEFVSGINANIRFKVHQQTNELMVQVVDQTNNRIIKEFPSHEFLDTVAAIRSYVGMLLDEKI